jgi:hypothetical protein
MRATWRPHQPLVIEGARHVEAVRCLRKLVAPAPLYLVHIVIDEPTRSSRLAAAGRDGGDVRTLDRHSTEIQVARDLPKTADLIVDGRRDLSELADEIALWLTTRVHGR